MPPTFKSPEDSSPDIEFAIRSYQRFQHYGRLREAELLDYADARKKTTLTLTCQEYWDFGKKFTDAWEAMVRNEMELEDANTTYQATKARNDEQVTTARGDDRKTVKAGSDAETVQAGAAAGEGCKDADMLEVENEQLDKDIREWLGDVVMADVKEEK